MGYRSNEVKATRLKIGSKSGLHYFSIDAIRSWNPCYDPSRYLSEDWRGNAVEILEDERISFHDRLWVVCRPEIVSIRVLRLFAVWCARQVQHLMLDPRSLLAIDVAERFAEEEATQEELNAARAAAWAAAQDAALAAARDAALAASGVAWEAAWEAARDANHGTQRDKLIEMLKDEGKERLERRRK